MELRGITGVRAPSAAGSFDPRGAGGRAGGFFIEVSDGISENR